MTDVEVSELTQGMVSKSALAQLRYRGQGPAFLKPTPKTVLYRRDDVVAWIEGSLRTTTAVA